MLHVPLFNQKTIDTHIAVVEQIPPEHMPTLERYSDLITSGRIYKYKETEFHSELKKTIVETILGYTGASDAEEYTVSSEQAILRGSVDLALGHFSADREQIIAPFELKDANKKDLDAIVKDRAKSPVQQVWEYATNAPGVKWVLVSNYLEIRLYGFGEGTQSYEVFDLAKLTDPKEYSKFIRLLSADNLLSGATQDLLEESRKEEKRITDALYADYKTIRQNLIYAVREELGEGDPLKPISIAQTILDRVLFTAFAEDTGLLPNQILAKAFEHSDQFNPKPIWENFKGLFKAIDKGSHQLKVPPYNGGLFAPDPVIDNLNLSDEVCEGFKEIGAYDFGTEVSVTVLGRIFEQSISDVERLQAIARGEETEPEKKTGTTGRRKRDGVVYTPDYVARFIVDQTLGVHLNEIYEQTLAEFTQKGVDISDYQNIKWKRKGAEIEAWKAYRDRFQKLRIVDPACGSGVFLVMAFDFMKAELKRVNNFIGDLRGGVIDLFDPDSEILTNNLFGVDVNSESVEIAKLSLWVKTARRGKTLDSLDANLKVGDSLIEDSNYAYLEHGFTWQTAFKDVFDEGGFDVVLGNPPYVRQELLSALKPYLENRFAVYHGVADLYCYFFERGLRLLKKGGRLGYISSSTFFKTNSGKPLREFLRKQTTLERIVDFGDIQIFDGVATLPAILTMRNEKPTETSELQFWNIKDLPKSNFRASFKDNAASYPQKALGDGSWELENPALRALREKITKGKKTLKEIYGSPLYGIKTGRNEAFVIDRATRDRLIAEDPKSAEVLKPFLEGKDLKRWRAENRDIWLIFTRRGIDIDKYPAIKKHLEGHRLKLEPKPKDWKPSKPNEKWQGRKQGDYKWFEIQDTVDYYKAFLGLKIVYPHFSRGNSFFLDSNALYSNDKSYILNSGDSFLLTLLNSSLLWFLIKAYSPQVIGGSRELRSYYINTLPIPDASDPQKAQLAKLAEDCQTAAEQRLELQRNLSRRISDLCPPERDAKLSNKLKNWWEFETFTDFQKEIKKQFKTDVPLAERNEWEDWIARDREAINLLSADIKTNEDEINKLVYELFSLTPEEIKLLEENI